MVREGDANITAVQAISLEKSIWKFDAMNMIAAVYDCGGLNELWLILMRDLSAFC